MLDHPEYACEYHEYRMHANENNPFMYATLDGELTEVSSGRKGILEIKTTTIRNSEQWKDWDERIPDMYYAQILHQLYATGYFFAVLRAYIRYEKGGEIRATVRDYHIERSDVLEDIGTLVTAETAFWNDVLNRKRPDLILPEI